VSDARNLPFHAACDTTGPGSTWLACLVAVRSMITENDVPEIAWSLSATAERPSQGSR